MSEIPERAVRPHCLAEIIARNGRLASAGIGLAAVALTAGCALGPQDESIPNVPPSSSTATSKVPTGTVSHSIELPAGSTEADRIAQTLIVGFRADRMTPAQIEAVVRDTHIGGLYLTYTDKPGTNKPDAASLGFTASYFKELGNAAGVPLMVTSDEEGGNVLRFRYDEAILSAQDLGAEQNLAETKRIGQVIGTQMNANGVDVDLAPVVDLDNGNPKSIISGLGRSFGADPLRVESQAGAFMDGLEEGNITPVLKHFPGLGRADKNNGDADANTDLHKVEAPDFADLQNHDLTVYGPLLARHPAAMVMLSNEYVPGLDDERPASLSQKVVQYLRKVIGFQGIIMTDSLTGPSKYDGLTIAQNVAASEAAGANAILFDEDGMGTAGIEAIINTIERTVSPAQINSSVTAILAQKTAAANR